MTSPPVLGAALLGLDHVGAPAEAKERVRAFFNESDGIEGTDGSEGSERSERSDGSERSASGNGAAG